MTISDLQHTTKKKNTLQDPTDPQRAVTGDGQKGAELGQVMVCGRLQICVYHLTPCVCGVCCAVPVWATVMKAHAISSAHVLMPLRVSVCEKGADRRTGRRAASFPLSRSLYQPG